MDISRFSEEQQQAILSDSRRLILKASAGSGKTTVLSNRVVHRITVHGVKPSSILVITFTTKATAELKKRIIEELKKHTEKFPGKEILDLPHISNFNTFGNSVIRENFTLLGFSDIPVLINEEQKRWFDENYFKNTPLPLLKDKSGTILKSDRIREVYSRLLSGCQSSNINRYGIENYLKKLSTNKSALLDPLRQEKYALFTEQNTLTLQNFIYYYDAYNAYKLENNLIDYADQINMSCNLIESNSSVRGYYRSRFRYIFVDEYQDTSLVQSRLTELLADGASLTIVGDANQSIYEWRQAEPGNIVNIEGDNLYLSTNYRSAGDIVNLGNRFRLYDRHAAARAHREDTGEELHVSLHQVSKEDEYEFVAQQALEIIRGGVEPKEIAILVRGRTSLPLLMKVLHRYNIPYSEYSQEGEATTNTALRLLQELVIVFENNTATNLNWIFVLERLCGFIPHQVSFLGLRENYNSITGILAKLGEAGYSERLATLNELYENYLDRQLQDFCLYAKKIFIREKILSTPAQLLRYDNAILDVTTADELLKKDTVASTRIDESEANRVHILTIHSSKGLEFNTVFVPFIRDKSFPGRNKFNPGDAGLIKHEHIPEELSAKKYYDRESGKFLPIPTLHKLLDYAVNDKEHPLNIHNYAGSSRAVIGDAKIAQAYNYYHLQNKFDEERRLLYVAITRAKHRLILSGEPASRDDGEDVDFFSELAGIIEPIPYLPNYADAGKLENRQDTALPVWLQPPADAPPPRIIPLPGSRPDIIKLNAYSLTTYNRCARLFYYSNSGLTTEPVFESQEATGSLPDNIIGNVVHSLIAQDYYTGIDTGQIPGLINAIIPAKYKNAATLPDSINRINKLYGNYKALKQPAAEVFVEYPAKHVLHNASYRVLLDVRLDRLEIYDDKIVIVDYKTTGDTRPDKLEDMFNQLRIYAIALSGNPTWEKKQFFGKILLLGGQNGAKEELVVIHHDDEESGRLKKDLIALAEKIYSSGGDKELFPKTDDRKKCDTCQYNRRCWGEKVSN